jgi:transposase
MIAEGGTRRAAARRFGVSAATAVRLAQRQAQTGSLAPGRQGRPAGSGKLAAFREIVIGWVEADGDLTLPELAERLAAEHGVEVHSRSSGMGSLIEGSSSLCVIALGRTFRPRSILHREQ